MIQKTTIVEKRRVETSGSYKRDAKKINKFRRLAGGSEK
jgi:hypothetical protein